MSAENRQRERATSMEDGIKAAMGQIDHRIVVFSGKGGVGKTTVSVNLAYSLAKRGKRVGLLDADITGPNVPQMVGIAEALEADGQRILPHEKNGVKIVSLASMVAPEVAIIWRGPLRSKAIEQLLGDAKWGKLDFLIMDLPPGTGDEVLTIAQRTSPQMAIIVTTPQEVALIDARRAVNMAKKMEIGRIGVVENMSGLVCPHCGERIDLFGTDGGRRDALRLGVRFLGAIPIDPNVRAGADAGQPILLANPDADASQAFLSIASRIEEILVE